MILIHELYQLPYERNLFVLISLFNGFLLGFRGTLGVGLRLHGPGVPQVYNLELG